ncbi:hypothetical protein JOB18_040375 [Solea senegalensis]|uniref:Uncharacterized protein n=1 Tax=Solea senegalensis TaxID=28829 RepID=A0AAV6Q7U7_SOLSE|nr:hypothetical protein JOB18_040375 [Solea senegalensis]
MRDGLATRRRALTAKPYAPESEKCLSICEPGVTQHLCLVLGSKNSTVALKGFCLLRGTMHNGWTKSRAGVFLLLQATKKMLDYETVLRHLDNLTVSLQDGGVMKEEAEPQRHEEQTAPWIMSSLLAEDPHQSSPHSSSGLSTGHTMQRHLTSCGSPMFCELESSLSSRSHNPVPVIKSSQDPIEQLLNSHCLI